MRVNVIGLGYIGLPTALSLAAGGLEVIGTDKNILLVEKLSQGDVSFEEKDLPKLFQRAKKGRLRFGCIPEEAEVYIISVPTPYDVHTKKIDVAYIKSAVEDVIAVAPEGAVLAVESTISPGTIDREVRPLVCASGKNIHIAHVPERIIPGNMIYELENNNRTIGVDDPETGKILCQIYSSFCKGILTVTSIKVAEMTKVVENTCRDIQIAFANELSRICHREGIDVYEVIRVANMHPRVQILNPGPGVGGHCISVDPWFLVGDYPDIVDIIASARRVNDGQPRYILARIHEIMEEYGIQTLDEVGFYGLTYKENVDDTRESPLLQMLEIMRESLAFGAKVYDPYVKLGFVENQYSDFETFLEGVKLVIVMVGHNHLLANADKLSGKLVYDTKNCLHGKNIENIIKL
jgi:UDP-N-acetyl-D-mannosaminuronic acid dehydrogenase